MEFINALIFRYKFNELHINKHKYTVKIKCYKLFTAKKNKREMRIIHVLYSLTKD